MYPMFALAQDFDAIKRAHHSFGDAARNAAGDELSDTPRPIMNFDCVRFNASLSRYCLSTELTIGHLNPAQSKHRFAQSIW